MDHALNAFEGFVLRLRWILHGWRSHLEYWRWRFNVRCAQRDAPAFGARSKLHVATGWIRRFIRQAGSGLSRVLAPMRWLLLPFRALAAVRLRFWVLLGLALVLYVFHEPLIDHRQIMAEYRYDHSRFSGTGVYDRTGKFLGLIPGQLDFLGDFSLGDRIAEIDHKTLYVETIPPVWWAVLRTLEDRYLGSWRSWGGIDWVSMLKAALWDSWHGPSRGASTLPMMLVRSMRHLDADPDRALFERLQRKLLEIRHAPVLTHYLGGNDRLELQRWLAMHVPLVKGVSGSRMGGSLYGLRMTAHIVFGQPLEQLNVGQQALLAAAFKKPILLSPANNAKGLAASAKRWADLKARAAWGLERTYGKTAARTLEGQRQLAALAPADPKGPVRLRSLLPDAPVAAFGVLANPIRRSLRFVRGEMIQAIAELQEAYGPYWRENVTAVRLNVDALVNSPFKQSVEQTLSRLEQRLRHQLELPLRAHGGRRDGSGRRSAQVIIALANAEGRLVRYYSNTADSTYAGIQRLRRQGRYQPELEARGIASLGKLPAALLLGSQGDTLGTYSYCNRRFAHVHNADGDRGVDSCRAENAYYRAEDVFARSLNLPLIWRLGQFPPETLQRLVDDFGLTAPADGALQEALPLGRVSATPRVLHRMMHAILMGVVGASPQAQLPRVVQQARVVGPQGRHTWQQPAEGAPALGDVRRYFQSPTTIPYVTQVLSAVLQHRYYGTLRSLEDWTAAQHPEVALHIAKTGTAQVMHNVLRDKLVAGGLVYRGQAYSYFVLVGSAHPSAPLGRNITSNDLAPLVRTVLKSLDHEPMRAGRGE